MDEHAFDPSLFGERLPSQVAREKVFTQSVRVELARVGAFTRSGRRLIFRRQDGRQVAVDRRRGSAFSRLVAATIGVSPRNPTLARALDVVVAEATEAVDRGRGAS